jgi:UDP-N-acetyl-D-galactosamine dehydrogenase
MRSAHVVTFTALQERKKNVAVVGLGYVGLPLAVKLSQHFTVTGFDISETRIADLKRGVDPTREVSAAELKACSITYSADPACLKGAGVIIVAVPTPVDQSRTPDLAPIRAASHTVGKQLTPGTVVVYESTVYPGLTEEVCVPILEAESNLKLGRDFSVGYSPERINPGDKVRTIDKIIKVVAGSDALTAELLVELYGTFVTAGIHKAPSIKVAEAAKVIENAQRDLNIALMNELAIIFQTLDIDTHAVLAAAGTKWNFLPFTPGLVGGHCIGVDPYYLTYKAECAGYSPEVILAGRRINDNMGKFIAQTPVKQLAKAGCPVVGARVGVLGLTFKENVPDLRNTKVVDVLNELAQYNITCLVHDAEAYAEEARSEYNIELSDLTALRNLDALLLAVPHAAYRKLELAEIKTWFAAPDKALLMDIKAFWDPAEVRAAGINYWRL